MRTRRNLVLLVQAVLVLSAACAVRNNPNLSPATKVELNIAHQLEQAQNDYKNFFIEVGKAKKLGILTSEQADGYATGLGNKVQSTISRANASWKQYQTYKDAVLREQILDLLRQINVDLLALVAKRNADLAEVTK